MGLGVEASLHINAGAARKGRLGTSGFTVSCARFAALSPESVRLSGAGLRGPLAGVCRWHLASQRQVLCRHALLGSGADSGGGGREGRVSRPLSSAFQVNADGPVQREHQPERPEVHQREPRLHPAAVVAFER